MQRLEPAHTNRVTSCSRACSRANRTPGLPGAQMNTRTTLRTATHIVEVAAVAGRGREHPMFLQARGVEQCTHGG